MQFRGKERETRVKDRAKNGARKRARRVAMVQFFARPKPKIPFPRSFLLRNQTQTLATSESYVSLPDRCRDNFYQNLLARPGPALPQVGPLKVVCHQTCVGLETDLPTIQNTKKERFDRI